MHVPTMIHGLVGGARALLVRAQTPKIGVLFVPGNPGLSTYYASFLESLCHEKELAGTVTALCVSSLGHDVADDAAGGPKGDARNLFDAEINEEPVPPTGRVSLFGFERPYYTLQDQIKAQEHALRTLQAMLPPGAPVFVFGHSVGAYIALQLLQANPAVHGVYLLFPTVSYIARAPRARSLVVPLTHVGMFFLHYLTTLLAMLPFAWVANLVAFVTRMGQQPARTTASFVVGRGAAFNALGMAGDEMRTITAIPPTLLDYIDKHNTIVRAYWGAGDSVRSRAHTGYLGAVVAPPPRRADVRPGHERARTPLVDRLRAGNAARLLPTYVAPLTQATTSRSHGSFPRGSRKIVEVRSDDDRRLADACARMGVARRVECAQDGGPARLAADRRGAQHVCVVRERGKEGVHQRTSTC